MSGDPRVPVVTEAIGQRWATWLSGDTDGRPAPVSIEAEAEAILEALDDHMHLQLAATGVLSARFAVLAIVAKLSRTQAALSAAVLAQQTDADVPAETVEAWERIAAGEVPVRLPDGLSG